MLVANIMTAASSDKPTPQAKVRLAATLILMREGGEGQSPEYLIVRRSQKMRFAGGAIVFPGGAIDQDDFYLAESVNKANGSDLPIEEAAARIGAIRETMEEAGLAIAISGIASGDAIKEARQRLHEGETFGAIVSRAGWQLHPKELYPWARWTPPGDITHRFDTRFYLADATSLSADGWVDNSENDKLFWKDARTLLDMVDANEAKTLFPTRRNLERLAQFNSFDEAREHAENYPVRPIEPRIEKRADGEYLCIPSDVGYPICEEPIETALRR